MPSYEQKTIVGIGELLWDLLPEGEQLGGAPANFAYCANLLGDVGIAASRVGRDALGDRALDRMNRLDLKASFIQCDETHPTGTVKVSVDARGEPTFQITQQVAWDFLEWRPEWKQLAEHADAVCFGSLAQRAPKSRKTIRAFLAALQPGAARIFDANLRRAFYSADILADSMRLADIVKLNHEELPRVTTLLGLAQSYEDASLDSQARNLMRVYDLKLVCVTRGANGSLLVSKDQIHEHSGFPVRVVDTVGAGDAFTAALVHHFLRGSSLAAINEAANRMGAWIASKAGATPPAEAEVLDRVRISL